MRRRPHDDLPVFRRLYCDGAVFIRYGNNRITPYDVPSFVLFLSTGRRREERDQNRKRKWEFRKIITRRSCQPDSSARFLLQNRMRSSNPYLKVPAVRGPLGKLVVNRVVEQ